MTLYSWAWDHIAALFINTWEAGLLLLPYSWLNHNHILFLIVWTERKHTHTHTHTGGKAVMKHHRHDYYTHSRLEYKFPMQLFVFIHQYSLFQWIYHWSAPIDPVLNPIVVFLFSCEAGEAKRKGDQMSWWQHGALSKVALSIKIDREREQPDISAGPQPADILQKLSFLFSHHLLLHTKTTAALAQLCELWPSHPAETVSGFWCSSV